jgi:NADPH:quinone reductase-like Zn-dependent oxidoreductase
MKVMQLVRHGDDASCFQMTEVNTPDPKPGEVLIRVHASGLNYADVMARKGLYRDAPPLPSVLGYDVVGVVDRVGEGGDQKKLGKQVAAVTEFGGYAQYAIANENAVMDLPFEMPLPAAAALTTQYATAYYAAFQLGNIQEGDHVFIHAAAGGVGLALIQFCKLKNCVMYGTVSNEKKAALIRQMGVHTVINSSIQNVHDELRSMEGKLDVVFDSVGGKAVKLGMKALRAGGRMICYGGSQLLGGKGLLHKIGFGLSFGFYHPVALLAQSKSILGVNMLKLMRKRPESLRGILSATAGLLKEKKITVPAGETFPVDELFKAHLHLESRQSIGKIVVEW